MATYLSAGSSVKGDSVKTLYLLNPSYAGYNDSTNSGNMVLVGPSTGTTSQVGSINQQQQYPGFSLPTHISQQPHMAVMPNTNMGHQNAASEILNNSQGFGWNGGNELLFIPSSDSREVNQSLTARLNSISPGQQPSSGMSHIGMRNLSQTSFQEQMPFIPSGVAITESMHAPACAGQILSLSLSSQPSLLNQMQHFPIPSSESGIISVPGFNNVTIENYPGKGERYPNQWMEGSSNSLRVSSNILGPGFQEHLIGSGSNRQLGTFSTPPKVDIYTSKYLKPAQELLNEVVSIGKEVKRNSSNPSTNAEPWATPNSYNSTSFQDRMPVEMSRKDGASITSAWGNGNDSVAAASTTLNVSEQNFSKAVNRNSSNTSMNSWATLSSYNNASFQENTMETSRKDGGSIATAWGNEKESSAVVSTMADNSAEQNVENNMELTTAERQDIQTKKSKLMTMLDEVEQRYRQYNHQMQIVVASFESTAGFGAARAYTALALQTISKHFRSLKDAIKGQIRVASKALGEEESVGQEKRETSRLRFIDQQLHQQRALQQLGMMQQHPWRPQRGLPERSVSVLRAWLFEHFLHPYPKDSDKVLLARQTGLSRNQVSNWFINARVRLWKPMVEEMYAEEVKDSDGAEGADKPIQIEGEETKGKAGSSGNNGVNKPLLRATLTEQKNENFAEAETVTKDQSNEVALLQRNSLKKSLPESLLFHEKQSMGEVAKKGSSLFLSPNLNTGLEYKSEELHDAEMLVKLRSEDRHLSDYSAPHDGIIQGENQNLGAYGVFSGLNRFSGEGLAASYATSNNVSLTLGLHRSEGLSLSGSQHPYLQGHGQLHMLRRQENGMNTLNYYGMTDNNGSWQLQGFDSSR